MASLRVLTLAAALAQASTPSTYAQSLPTPTNLRLGTGSCDVGETGTAPNCFPSPPAPASSGQQWEVVYSEEFDGTSLDTTKLTPCFDWNYGACTDSFNQGKERYLPSQVQISDGTAKLVAEPLIPAESDPDCYQNACTYKAGLVSTARPRADEGSPYLFPFTYGYVESRMKFPGTAGFFTAFWMLPTNPSYSYDTEIDIVEILGGQPETIWMHYHYNNRNSYYRPNTGQGNNGACAVQDYSDQWVTFGLDWQPNHIAWYIEGTKCGQFDGDPTTIEDGPMQLILHMMVDNSWQRSVGSVLASQDLVEQLEIDYIRIYQQGTGDGSINSGDDGTTSGDDGTTSGDDGTTSGGSQSYPDANNTGWQHTGVTLRPYTGPSTITVDNTIIDSADINTCLTIQADNVSIKRSKITRNCLYTIKLDGAVNFLLEDSEFGCEGNYVGLLTSAGSSYVARRVHGHGCENIIFSQGGSGNFTIEDSFIEETCADATEPHSDGIQMWGSETNVTIAGNTIYGYCTPTARFASSALTGGSLGLSNLTIEDNLFAGGGYTLRLSEDGAKLGSNVVVKNNKFSTVFKSTSGNFGPFNLGEAPDVFCGNTWYDGPNVGKIIAYSSNKACAGEN